MNAQPGTAVAASPIKELRAELEGMGQQFQAALPAHIPVERFKRVVMTALQNNPDLITAERRSLWNSAMKAAQDGLLPDGREGAMVIYRTKKKDGEREFWVEAVQWMPMIAGIRKKVRNSGEIATWDAQVVHRKDHFKFQLGDDPLIEHVPTMEADPGAVIAAYSIATLKSGEKSREVMTVSQIEKVRAISKAKDAGPWKTHYEEMCRKTVARRHSKVLPMSTDLDDLIRRDDDLYDFKGDREAEKPQRPKLADFSAAQAAVETTRYDAPKQITAKPDDAGDTSTPADPETGELPADEAPDFGPPEAMEEGRKARIKGLPRKSYDRNYTEPLIDAYLVGYDEQDAAMTAEAGKAA